MTMAIFHRVAFILEDDVCRELEALVPLDQRHQVVNAALRRELELLRQRQGEAAPDPAPRRRRRTSAPSR